jgi:hypothetical protein
VPIQRPMATEKKKPKKPNPDEFLLRPEEVARMRQVAVKGGMSADEFEEHLVEMRKNLRATGKLHLPPKLKAAITKGSDRKAPEGLQSKVTKRAERRAGNRPEPKFVYGKPNPNYKGPGGPAQGKQTQGKPKAKVVVKNGKFATTSPLETLREKLGR